MRFINHKAKDLYLEIERRSIIVEDAYVIPKEEECFDTMGGELYYGSNEFFTSTFDKWEMCEKQGKFLEETVIQIVSEFVLVAEKIFITKEGLAKVREFLSNGVLEKLLKQKKEKDQNDWADMRAEQKEKEEKQAFPSSFYW